MRLHRFFVEENLEGKSEIVLASEGLIHQVRDVFRLVTGDMIILFSGNGTDVTFEIRSLSKKEIILSKVSGEKTFVPLKKVTLLMSLIKKDNFELVLEKATEIGVTNFVPVITERTLLKNLNVERAEKILKEASEQCGRGDIPMLKEAMNLDDALKNFTNIIAFDISGEALETRSTKSEIRNENEISILIGPEGGWSEKEIQLFKEKNIPLYKLGETTLRAETAAIVASSLVLI